MDGNLKTIGEILFRYRKSKEPALIFHGRIMTYQHLYESCASVALQLRRRGLKKGDRLVLDMERSQRYVCMMLGIAMSGGVVVSIHKGWPAFMREQVLMECDPFLIVTDEMADAIMESPEEMPPGSVVSLLPEVKGEDPFQIVYTSGSTGKPKGTVLCHLMAANISLCSGKNAMCRHFAASCRRSLLDADFSFVASSIVMMQALFNEKAVVIASREEISSPGRLAVLCQREEIDEVCWTPSRIFSLLSDPDMARAARRIRVMMVAGEKIPEKLYSLIAQFMSDTTVYCAYGMSEMMQVEDHPFIPGRENLLGCGCENIALHVLDPKGESVLAGETGEICISGIPAQLGYYWRDSELTEKRYMRHPVYGRIFRTGDLAVLEQDGGFRIAGRKDQMTKLRGMRIDLEAIEQAILMFPGVAEAVVMILGEGEGQTLAAFYTRKDQASFTGNTSGHYDFEQELRVSLSGRLPYYMVPAWLTELSEMPLNYNGKTDLLALSRLAPKQTAYRASVTELEHLLCELFADVLRLPRQAGADDSFFVLGGDSMSGMELIVRLKEKGLHMDIKMLFAGPTPGQLAKVLRPVRDEDTKDSMENLPPMPDWTYAQAEAVKKTFGKQAVECLYPVTRGMERHLRRGDAWMLADFHVICFDEKTQETIRLHLAQMTCAHQALRSVFLFPEGERPVQAVLKEYTPSFFFADLSADEQEGKILSGKQKTAISQALIEDVDRGTEPVEGPLFVARLFRTHKDQALLYRYYSHTLLDGEAQLRLLDELLGKTKIRSDREILGWHFRRIQYAPRQNALAFWRRLGLGDAISSLPGPYLLEKTGGNSRQSFSAGDGRLLKELKDYCKRTSITLAAILCYCLGEVACRKLKVPSFTFLTVSNGRMPEEKGILGCFAHEYPFVFHDGDSLEDCQGQLLSASEHAWIFSMPEDTPSLKTGENSVFLDMINVYAPEINTLPPAQVLDAKGLGKYMSGINSKNHKSERISIFSAPQLGYLCRGTYDPACVDSAFMKEFAKELSLQLQSIVSADTPQPSGEKNPTVWKVPDETKPGIFPSSLFSCAKAEEKDAVHLAGKKGEKPMLAIWGFNDLSVKMIDRLSEEEREQICLVLPKKDTPVKGDGKVKVFRVDELPLSNIEKILIPSMGVFWNVSRIKERAAYRMLKNKIGLEDDRICFMDYPTFDRELTERGSMDALLKSETIPFLMHLEYEVTHHCNLNCRSCSHFSPLTEKKFGDLEQFLRDLERIRSMIDYIGEIQLLGGEPLLNPDLYRFVQEARRIYPYAQINVVTNGILLMSVDERLKEAMKSTGAAFRVSVYPPFKSYVKNAIQQLKKEGLLFRSDYEMDQFSSGLNPDGSSDAETADARCMQNYCHIFENGKLSRCGIAHKIPVYAGYYHLENVFPDCSLNLYDRELTPRKLQSYLMNPIEMCRYCGKPVVSPWMRAGKNPEKEDWAGEGPF